MRIGLDFDNTIVCYDRLFHAIARDAGLIPANLPATKLAVRDHLRSIGREDDWTEMQGVAYTTRILEAEPFPGVIEFLAWARQAGIEIAIVSQKTVYPFRGARNNLHDAARGWIAGRLQKAGALVSPDLVFFELSKQDKLARVASLGCTHFVDDLPELLLDSAFPSGAKPILFDPAGTLDADPRVARMTGWNEIRAFFEGTWAQRERIAT